MTINPKTIEKVGILLVHGIGETKKFENIEAVARNIATALRAAHNLDVRVIVNTSDNAGFRADQQIWLADGKEPVIIEVKEYDPNDPSRNKIIKITQLCFTEAWWADLGKADTLKSQISFWIWGLSLWSRKQDLGKIGQDVGVVSQVLPPSNTSDSKPISFSLPDRFRFFVVSLVVLLILPLLSFLSVILRQILGFNLRADILVQYLGDIKHYQDEQREGAGYIIDMGQPLRIPIRRRMIKALVKMGLANYDRWYILSHSLGTVVAFNGLMEPDSALPNYLNQDLWEQVKNSKIKTTADDGDELSEKQANSMFPDRLFWLSKEEELDKNERLSAIISRQDLFKNLKGFMTYGSPLSKFAVVWPAIVPINNNNQVFDQDFEWINVYDPTDPVADLTKSYFTLNKPEKARLPVTEIAYKAESIHLLSHIEYLTYNPKRPNPLVQQVAYWLLKGEKFQTPSRKSWGWPQGSQVKVYQSIRYLIWLIAGLIVSQMLAFLVSEKLPKIVLFSNPLLYLLGAAVMVFLFGFITRAINGLSNRTDD